MYLYVMYTHICKYFYTHTYTHIIYVPYVTLIYTHTQTHISVWAFGSDMKVYRDINIIYS